MRSRVFSNTAKTAVNQSNFIEAEHLQITPVISQEELQSRYEASKDMISNATRKSEDAQAMNTDASQAWNLSQSQI